MESRYETGSEKTPLNDLQADRQRGRNREEAVKNNSRG
jgi:hypothetical protein